MDPPALPDSSVTNFNDWKLAFSKFGFPQKCNDDKTSMFGKSTEVNPVIFQISISCTSPLRDEKKVGGVVIDGSCVNLMVWTEESFGALMV